MDYHQVVFQIHNSDSNNNNNSDSNSDNNSISNNIPKILDPFIPDILEPFFNLDILKVVALTIIFTIILSFFGKYGYVLIVFLWISAGFYIKNLLNKKEEN